MRIEELLKADLVSTLEIEVEQSITANAEGESRIVAVHFMPPSAAEGLD